MKRFLLILSSTILVLGCQKEVYHNITVSINPAEGGSVSPSSGPVLDGTSVSFKATPNGDYAFMGWSGSISGTENPKTVTVTQDMNVTANFTLRSYPLTLTIEGDGTVAEKVVSTKSEYQSGTVVELTANPSDFWLFDHWEGDMTGSTNPVRLTVSSAMNVKAVFVEKTYPLNVEIEGEGAVSENIIQTKATYQEGTVVELTANPSNGWSFDHWERDLEGDENPAQITVSSEKTVKAVFVKNNYSFNVKIVGPGAVDEYLVEQTKATVEYGKQVKLVAIPAEGVTFKGWGGSISGTEKEIVFNLDSDKEILATFSKEASKYPMPNLLDPWAKRKCFYAKLDFSGLAGGDPADLLSVDYNMDGYVDAVTTVSPEGEWISDDCPVRFYLGGPDGSFTPDEKNNRLGLIAHDPRKTMYGDLNGDGAPDFLFIGHGYDAEPWPGEAPVFVLSNPEGSYTAHTISETVGYYHGSTTGDIDNDGDLDVILIEHSTNSRVLNNDGLGNFTVRDDLLNYDIIKGNMYSSELYDIDNDGYLDLFVGGHEHEGPFDERYKNTTCVFWGNGQDYKGAYSRLPRFIDGYGVTLDYCFYDIDQDGQDEIINVRTGDGFFHPSYTGWKIQIVDYDGRQFIDVTQLYVSDSNNGNPEGRAVLWIDVEEIEGRIFLCGRISENAEKLFEISGGKFLRCEEKPNKFTAGFCLYSDGSGVSERFNLGCTEEKYGGKTSIMFSNWPTWRGWGIDYSDFMDFSKLEEENYYLEFAIKNEDPDLCVVFSFETRLQTEPWYFPSYEYTYRGNEHKSNGTWDLIQVPLKSLNCGEEWPGYYWNTIKGFGIMPGDCHGKDFYLDEIRIRKILPE